jgi:tRNA A-37 threonylcarbamoyl transferase component Bud32
MLWRTLFVLSLGSELLVPTPEREEMLASPDDDSELMRCPTKIDEPWRGPGPAAALEGGAPPTDDQWRGLPVVGRAFLAGLVRGQLLGASAVGEFLAENADRLPQFADAERLGQELVKNGLLTEYQLGRIMAGSTHGMILGNHRVLDRLGRGSMGVVYLAEHLFLKRRVAVKVVRMDDDGSRVALVERFYAEMRVLAELHHPHVVTAYDAGKIAALGVKSPPLLYLVMELVPGGNLDEYVRANGPASVSQACLWISQAARAVQAAHDRQLIHRDVKPSNLLLTRDRQVKVADFGLVRQFCSQLTERRMLLGTVSYMAPEQSIDPTAVGSQADIYGLGATLFWLLSGATPYPETKTVRQALTQLQEEQPRRLRSLRPEIPEALDALVARMVDRDPIRRPALPLTVARALDPFCR